MYPAARIAILLMVIFGLLLLGAAVVAGLVAFGVVKSTEQIDAQNKTDLSREVFYGAAAVYALLTGLAILMFCDMVRAVINTAANTGEMLRMMREEGRMPLARR